jgi:hypothetical protein
MRARATARFLAPLLILTACDVGGSHATLSISGDTLVHVATFGLPDGQENANCGYRFVASVAGEPGDTAVITQGSITYSFAEDGAEHGRWDWTPERLPTIWDEPRIAAGQQDTSKHHDIAFSLPFRPIRGEVVFEYRLAGDEDVRRTTPFTFTCR